MTHSRRGQQHVLWMIGNCGQRNKSPHTRNGLGIRQHQDEEEDGIQQQQDEEEADGIQQQADEEDHGIQQQTDEEDHGIRQQTDEEEDGIRKRQKTRKKTEIRTH